MAASKQQNWNRLINTVLESGLHINGPNNKAKSQSKL